MYSCGEGVSLVKLSILAGAILSMLRDLWVQTQGDNSFEVNEGSFKGLWYEDTVSVDVGQCWVVDWRHSLDGTGNLSCGEVSLETAREKPVIRYMQVFVRVKVTFGTRRNGEGGVW